MKTSNFQNRNLKGKGVSIARYSPRWWQGEKYPQLAPTMELFRDAKNGAMSPRVFRQRYEKEVLAKLDPKQVYKDLKDKIILCWEKPGDFCHRRIVAMWLEKNLGVKIPEL